MGSGTQPNQAHVHVLVSTSLFGPFSMNNKRETSPPAWTLQPTPKPYTVNRFLERFVSCARPYKPYTIPLSAKTPEHFPQTLQGLNIFDPPYSTTQTVSLNPFIL